MGYWLVDRHPGSARWRSTRIDLVDKLLLHKNGKSINNIYLYTVHNIQKYTKYSIQNIIKIGR